jgi:enolase
MILMGKGENDPRISSIKAREILDSKARPMVEVDVWTVEGLMGRGASPCGTSVGSHEAFVLRDGGSRFGGLGVLKAVKNVNKVISPALKGKSVLEQREIDNLLIELDGTTNKSRLGANAIYSVSMAVARAAANLLGLPLYRYLGGMKAHVLPVPIFNMINGGSYPDATMEFQEFLLIPTGAKAYGEALRMGVEIFDQLGDTIKKKGGQRSLYMGSSAGYAAPTGEPAEALEMLLTAAQEAGYEGKVKLGLDCAASHFFYREKNCYSFRGKEVSKEEIICYLEDLNRSYPLFLIEDPLEEDDFEGFAEMTRRFRSLIIGDDLFVTNLERLKKGIALGSANGMILKPNMIGTLSEAMDAADLAKKHGYTVIGSGRSGGSVDDPIPEISVAVATPLVKFGAPRTGERLAKQNSLLRIEEELGKTGRFAGLDIVTSQ